MEYRFAMYQVLDEKGEELGLFRTREEAARLCRESIHMAQEDGIVSQDIQIRQVFPEDFWEYDGDLYSDLRGFHEDHPHPDHAPRYVSVYQHMNPLIPDGEPQRRLIANEIKRSVERAYSSVS